MMQASGVVAFVALWMILGGFGVLVYRAIKRLEKPSEDDPTYRGL